MTPETPASTIPAGASPTRALVAADLLAHVVAARDLDEQGFTSPTWLWHGNLGRGKLTLT